MKTVYFFSNFLSEIRTFSERLLVYKLYLHILVINVDIILIRLRTTGIRYI